MRCNDLDTFRDWFTEYSRTFYTDVPEDNKNIALKIRHTSFVCENAIRIAQVEQWSDNNILLAETAALFHDIGRFLQYSQYKTFLDNISVNHGKLGAEILRNKQVLSRLPLDEQDLIINTVRFHNAFKVPSFEQQQHVLFLQLIRDADKLDIWRVFAEYYQCPEDEKPSAVNLGLPDLPDYSEPVLNCLYERKTASLAEMKTLNDFKLLQISWVYGLHFRHTFRLTVERDLIGKIASTLPQTAEIAGAIAAIEKFVEAMSEVKETG